MNEHLPPTYWTEQRKRSTALHNLIGIEQVKIRVRDVSGSSVALGGHDLDDQSRIEWEGREGERGTEWPGDKLKVNALGHEIFLSERKRSRHHHHVCECVSVSLANFNAQATTSFTCKGRTQSRHSFRSHSLTVYHSEIICNLFFIFWCSFVFWEQFIFASNVPILSGPHQFRGKLIKRAFSAWFVMISFLCACWDEKQNNAQKPATAAEKPSKVLQLVPLGDLVV